MNPLYVLTEMTGREAAEQRTVVIGSVELNWRLWLVLLGSFVAALPLTFLAFAFVGQLGLVTLPVVLGLGALLFYRRSTQGLQLRTYRALLDTRKARAADQFYLCGLPIDTSDSQVKRLMTTAAAYTTPSDVPRSQPLGNAPTKRRAPKRAAHLPEINTERPTHAAVGATTDDLSEDLAAALFAPSGAPDREIR
ncbi:hypothetical protein [Nocardioides sp. Leaf285]|uniref:hypothetical protein n=1 Tax=Nocardioides sp. Leaf285 TaxID=1736322 RepID=UPI0007039557|nr:hypothetical protein [Nocardioides sp. Leaf285]KQP62876.1 hypothetical protein ASF47_17845 [Nocardioides sp. Leaf285]